MSADPLRLQQTRQRRFIEAFVLILAAGVVVGSNRFAAHSRDALGSASAERSGLARRLQDRQFVESTSDRPTKSKANNSQPNIPANVNPTDFDLAMQSADLRLGRTIDEEQYGAFFRKLALTPGQTEQFLTLRSRYRQEIVDADAASKNEGLPRDNPAADRLKQAAKDRLAAAERDLLGDNGFRRLQDYERTSEIRNEVVAHFAGDLAFTDDPLRAEQAEQLVRVIDAVTAAPNGGKQVDWDRVVAQSRAILSAQQLVVFSAFATAQRREQLIGTVRQLISEVPPSIAPPTGAR